MSVALKRAKKVLVSCWWWVEDGGGLFVLADEDEADEKEGKNRIEDDNGRPRCLSILCYTISLQVAEGQKFCVNKCQSFVVVQTDLSVLPS